MTKKQYKIDSRDESLLLGDFELTQYKYRIVLEVKHVKIDHSTNQIVNSTTAYITSNLQLFLTPDRTSFQESYAEACISLLNNLENFQDEGSGWKLSRIIRVRLRYSNYLPRVWFLKQIKVKLIFYFLKRLV